MSCHSFPNNRTLAIHIYTTDKIGDHHEKDEIHARNERTGRTIFEKQKQRNAANPIDFNA